MKSVQLLQLGIKINPGLSNTEIIHMAQLAARLGFSEIYLPEGQYDPQFILELEGVVEESRVALHTREKFHTVLRSANLDGVRQLSEALKKDSLGSGVVLDVNVFIGRTLNEAMARAERDARFTIAELQESGLFGTFEQVQGRIIELASAGVEQLIATVPYELDVADVLAQIRALVVGPAVKLGNS